MWSTAALRCRGTCYTLISNRSHNPLQTPFLTLVLGCGYAAVAYCFGASSPKDMVSEVVVVLDVATRVMSAALPSASQPKPSAAAQQALIWCFRLLHRMIGQQQSLELSAAAAASDTGSKTAAGTTSAAVERAGASVPMEGPAAKSGKLVLSFMNRVLPDLLQHSSSLVCIGAALQLMCICPGSSAPAHRLMRSLESQLNLAAAGSAPQVELAPDPRTIMQQGSNRLLAVYLTLLGHMCQLYEAEAQEFSARLRAAAASKEGKSAAGASADAGGPSSEAAASQVPKAGSKGRQVQIKGGAAKRGAEEGAEGEMEEAEAAFDYMHKEEAARSMRALAQQFLKVCHSTVIAWRLPTCPKCDAPNAYMPGS